MRALSIAATGMMAQQMNVEVISNNIANLNTTGFKRSRAEFSDLMYQAQRRPGVPSADTGEVTPSGIQLGLGVKPAAVSRVHTQGNLTPTENQLDIAIQGRGYLIVDLPDREQAFTRAGALQRSAEGELVTLEGCRIAPGIEVPDNARAVTINANGEVFATVDDEAEPQALGQIEIAVFVNEAGLEATGDNLYRETEASGLPLRGTPGQPGFGTLRQGYVESSNVNVVQEITSLIAAQRAYEMNSKVVETGDQMLNRVTQMR